uniref:Putative ovule protein n=1 Tax=Solanum chacoense TaxID=4108 RepID=A0A0V0IKU5_SOLCH
MILELTFLQLRKQRLYSSLTNVSSSISVFYILTYINNILCCSLFYLSSSIFVFYIFTYINTLFWFLFYLHNSFCLDPNWTLRFYLL